MTWWVTIVMGAGVLMLAVGLLLFNAGILGLSEKNVVADVKAQLTAEGMNPEELQYMTSQGERLYGVLAYDEARTTGRWYVYGNPPGFHFGWNRLDHGTAGEELERRELEGFGTLWCALNRSGGIDHVTYTDTGVTRSVGGYPVVETAEDVAFFDAAEAEITALARP